jgi:hypothetical protein
MLMRALLIVGCWCLSPTLLAEEAKPPVRPAAPTAAAAPKPIPKQEWLAHVREKLPQTLCKKDQFFMKCFSVSEAECKDFSKIVVDACATGAASDLTDNVDAAQGEQWGMIISRCSYDLYDKYMSNKKHQKPECATPKPKAEQGKAIKP